MEHRHPVFLTSSFLGIVALCLLVGKSISAVPLLALVIVGGLSLFLFAFLYTDHAMVLLIIAMLLSPELVIGAVSKRQEIMVRIDDLLIVVFMLAWLARTAVFKDRSFITKLPVNQFILFYCCAFIFSTLKGMIIGNVVPIKGIFYVFKYIEYFMVFYLAAGAIKNKEQVITFLKVFILVLAVVNIYACTQIGSGRVSAPFQEMPGEPNTLGGYQVLMLGMVLGILTQCRSLSWRGPLLLILILFTLVPFSFTESRASYMAMIAMYLTMLFFTKGRMKGVLAAVLAIFVISSFFFLPSVIKERVMYTFGQDIDESVAPVTIGGVTLDPSSSARIDDWVRLFQKWQKKPFMGYGITGAGGFVDGQYITLLAETGVLGLFAFLFLLWNIFHRTLRIYRSTKDDLYKGLAIGFLSGTSGMIVHALTANTFIIIRIMEPYWFLAAMVMMVPKLETKVLSPPVKEKTDVPYLLNTEFLLKNGKV